jgi:catechol 2,3-dioxygenase-like lactoylglutathione lyase family enzyme
MDPDGAIDWYLRLWPSATRSSFAGRPAVAADMYLVFEEVGDPPSGSFDTALGRPVAQSAFWHIGAFVNTTNMDRDLAAIGVTHLPLYVGPDDEVGVWRSGLAPHTGTLARDQLASAEPAEPRPGGFSYVAGPDGVLFELTGGPATTPSLSHVHFFHEQPRCAANWYVANLGMAHPPVRGEGGTTSERPNYEPCEAELDPPGWPSLETVGTIREPRATVAHGNGSMSFYPRQCVADRCGTPRPLVPSRGQVLDHVGFVVRDVGAWHAWLTARGVGILEDIHEIPEGRAFMIEGPDRLAIELVEVGTPLLAQTPPAWTEPIEPFRIAEDLYWVGTAGLASYLLTSDQGHVLIDVPLEENVPRVLESIRALGFEPRDVRIPATRTSTTSAASPVCSRPPARSSWSARPTPRSCGAARTSGSARATPPRPPRARSDISRPSGSATSRSPPTSRRVTRPGARRGAAPSGSTASPSHGCPRAA